MIFLETAARNLFLIFPRLLFGVGLPYEHAEFWSTFGLNDRPILNDCEDTTRYPQIFILFFMASVIILAIFAFSFPCHHSGGKV